MSKMRQRVTMTADEAATTLGQELIELILLIASGGQLQMSDVRELDRYLHAQATDMPAFVYLRAIVFEVLQDGRIEAFEVFQLRRAMARVVPKSVREQVTAPLASIGLDYAYDEVPSSRPWHSHPATDKQLAYIQALGGSVNDVRTKGEASALIDRLLTEQPPTVRQQMVIRFFDRLDLLSESKDDVSLWLDALFYEKPAYEAAWIKYKRHVGDEGHFLDANSVPVGEYRRWLSAQAARMPTKRQSNRKLLPVVVLLAAFLLFLVVYAIARYR